MLNAEQQLLVEQHIDFATAFALSKWRFCFKTMSREEVISAGMEGLVEAVAANVSERGDFKSFAAWKIRNAIIRERDRSRLVHVPMYRSDGVQYRVKPETIAFAKSSIQRSVIFTEHLQHMVVGPDLNDEEDKAEYVKIREAFGALSSKLQETIEKVVIDGNSWVEAGKLLNVPKTTIQKRFNTGISQLKTLYNGGVIKRKKPSSNTRMQEAARNTKVEDVSPKTRKSRAASNRIGQSNQAYIDYLVKEHPELYKQVVDGKISVNAAAEISGYRKPGKSRAKSA